MAEEKNVIDILLDEDDNQNVFIGIDNSDKNIFPHQHKIQSQEEERYEESSGAQHSRQYNDGCRKPIKDFIFVDKGTFDIRQNSKNQDIHTIIDTRPPKRLANAY